MHVTLVMPKQISSHFEPPLGYGYLCHTLDRMGVQCHILDENLLAEEDEWIHRVQDVVFLTAYYTTAPHALRIAQRLRKERPDTTIVLGGVHFSYCGTQYIESGLADFLVLGEGEHLLKELIYCIERQASGHLSGKKIFGPTQDKDNLWTQVNPLNSIDLQPYRSISSEIGITLSRGCPHTCMFCVAPAYWGRKVRIAEKQVVSQMLATVAEMEFKTLSLWDESIWSAIRSPAAQSVMCVLREHKHQLEWRCHLRVDEMTTEILTSLSNAGCKTVRVGVESLGRESQRKIGKEFTSERLRQGLEIAREQGISVWCSMIIGLPGETYDGTQKAIVLMRDFMKDGLIDRVDCRPLTIIPGSGFHRTESRQGFKRRMKFPNSPKEISVVPPFWSYEQLYELLQEADDVLLPLSRVEGLRA